MGPLLEGAAALEDGGTLEEEAVMEELETPMALEEPAEAAALELACMVLLGAVSEDALLAADAAELAKDTAEEAITLEESDAAPEDAEAAPLLARDVAAAEDAVPDDAPVLEDATVPEDDTGPVELELPGVVPASVPSVWHSLREPSSTGTQVMPWGHSEVSWHLTRNSRQPNAGESSNTPNQILRM